MNPKELLRNNSHSEQIWPEPQSRSGHDNHALPSYLTVTHFLMRITNLSLVLRGYVDDLSRCVPGFPGLVVLPSLVFALTQDSSVPFVHEE